LPLVGHGDVACGGRIVASRPRAESVTSMARISWARRCVDQLCSCGVEAGEDAMQVGWATELGVLTELLAQRLVARRRGEEAIDESAQ